MKLLTAPAGRGVHWMRGGFRVLMKQPLAYSTLFMVFLFGLMAIVLGLPGLGWLLGLVLVPAANVGFVLASEATEAGRVPTPAALVAALRGPRARVAAVLQIGVAYALCALLAMVLADLIDPGFDARMRESMGAAQPTPPDDATQAGLLLRLLLPLPITLLFWHAPVIVHRTGMGAAKAVFASALACWRNRAAFVVYGLSWLGLLMVCTLAALGIARLLGQPALAVLLAVPATMMACVAFYASQYFSVVECLDFSDDTRPD